MSPPLDSNHVHSFKRIKGTKQYKCLNPDCHFLGTREFIKGKRALCPICRETYIVDSKALTLATLHCSNCTNSSKQQMLNKLQATLDDVIEEIL